MPPCVCRCDAAPQPAGSRAQLCNHWQMLEGPVKSAVHIHAAMQPLRIGGGTGAAAVRGLPTRALLQHRLPVGRLPPARRLRVQRAVDAAAAAGRGPGQPCSAAHAGAGASAPEDARELLSVLCQYAAVLMGVSVKGCLHGKAPLFSQIQQIA